MYILLTLNGFMTFRYTYQVLAVLKLFT
jgi:hypothetical protein